MRICTSLALFLLLAAQSAGAQVAFESSDLPIVLIDTGGEEIPDEPKIAATMGIIDNGPGVRNLVTDPANDYEGDIGIEVRGSYSQWAYPKKQYGFETRDAEGQDDDVELLGMPEENDWILSAPYADKSLVRNALAYRLARSMGRYAPRTRFVELVLNDEYQGVFVLTERIKRDENRVDINNLKPGETEGDDLSGGYIFRSDRTEEGEGWDSEYPAEASDSGPVRYGFRDPKPEDIAPEQADYIEAWMDHFEDVVILGNTGEHIEDLIDLGSFIDFVIVNELARNPDAYRLSTYYHKDKDSNDPRLHAGPVWDFNTSFGGVVYLWGTSVENLQIDADDFPGETYPRPVWWSVLFNSEVFQTAFRLRWEELRQDLLSEATLEGHLADLTGELAEAQVRNFERWPVLGVDIWPNAFVGETYAEEVEYLRTWVLGRAAWMDGRLPVAAEASAGEASALLGAPVPNPTSSRSSVTLTTATPQYVRVDLIDTLGRRVQTLFDGPVAAAGSRRLEVRADGVAPGLYMLRATSASGVATRPITILR